MKKLKVDTFSVPEGQLQHSLQACLDKFGAKDFVSMQLVQSNNGHFVCICIYYEDTKNDKN